MSDSLRLHGLQHARASLSITNSWSLLKLTSLSWCCHLPILSSDVPFSSCPQSFLASESFPVSQFFTSGGQSIGASASTSIRPSDDYSGVIFFRMDWLDLLAVQGTLKSLLQRHCLKASVLCCSASFRSNSPWWLRTVKNLYVTTGKAGIIYASASVVTVGSTILQLHQVGSPEERH